MNEVVTGIKLVWGQEQTEEILDHWLGDAANKQARENLFLSVNAILKCCGCYRRESAQ